MKNLALCILLALLLAAQNAPAQDKAQDKAPQDKAVDQLLDQIVAQEQRFLKALSEHAPLFETYIQESAHHESSEATADSQGDPQLVKDHYFLGRARIQETVGYEPLIEKTTAPPAEPKGKIFGIWSSKQKTAPGLFFPRGFAQMAIVDLHGFNRETYRFDFVRREFLGDVRTLVFEVSPIRRETGRFLGRIWVEERGAAIVRFNGTYISAVPAKGVTPEVYFHFDSWRANVDGGQWIPSHIYIEEDGTKSDSGHVRFKAQTRIWDYAATPSNGLEELTQILIESENPVKDQAASHDVSPLESQRAWERQAEENVLSRLEKGGLLAPAGPVDEVLNTVVSNLIVSGKLNVEARCRVLLTTPLETFSIGHTIVISRGLIDVLPDEASLALVLADELSHIALGHRTPTQFAFYNQTMLSDAELLGKLRFERTTQELEEASAKTIEIMRASPYKETGNAGLFLKALASRGQSLPRLLAANMGNQVANQEALARLTEFTLSAPDLEESKLEQIAALPLGSRIKLDPYSDRIGLIETKPVSFLSAREKMPFEITPFVPYLTLADSATQVKPVTVNAER